MDDNEINNMFVYGTLIDIDLFEKRFKIRPEQVRSGYIHAKMYNCGRFPMIMEDLHTKVFGFVLTFSDLNKILPAIDRYECCLEKYPKDSIYIRKIVQVMTVPSEQFFAWAYVGNESSSFCSEKCVEKNLIESGKWKID